MVSSSASGSPPHTQTGQLRRADAAAGEVGEEALHPAVLERVEGDRRQAAALAKQFPGGGQRPVELESSSSLTAIRIAWKVRLAGWPRPKR